MTKERFKREIFMKCGSYEMCQQVGHTASGHSIERDDYLLMFHPQKGEFIAKQGMGTWMEQEAIAIFDDLKKLFAEKRELLKALIAFVDHYEQAGIGACKKDDEDFREDGFDGDEVFNVRQARAAIAKATAA